MRRAGWAAVAACAILASRAAVADEAEDLYRDIEQLGNVKLDQRGKKPEEIRDQALKLFDSIIAKSESFRTRFPDAPKAGEVVYEEAKAYFYRSRYSDTKREDLDKGAELAAKAVQMDPKADAALKARALLMQNHKMNGRHEQVIEQAKAIAADFANRDEAAVALRYEAEAYESLKKDAEAMKAWEKLAADYPTTANGRRAAGVVAFSKMKGQPLDLSFTSTEGAAIDVKAFRGRVVLLFFWATTDESSKSNLAYLAMLEKPLRERGLTVLGVCLTTSAEAMEAELKKVGATWPEYCDRKKWDNELVVKLGIRAVPAAILIDRTGKVREVGLLGSALADATRGLLDESGK